MTIKMTIMPHGQQVDVTPGETILASAIRAGIFMPSGCQGGMCGACKGKILSGKIEHGSHAATRLTDNERSQGLALFCRAIPKTDLMIECEALNKNRAMQIKTLPCRVQLIEKVSHDVAILTLKLPIHEPFSFLAGQYIDILMKDGKKRSFSIANSPHENTCLELHIRHVAGGEFSEYVFNGLKDREILRFIGPLGSFYLREESDKPIIFIASGTGFAPIKSIVEHAFHIGVQREMIFYWGARTREDLYMIERPVAWQDHKNFTFIPVLSEPKTTDGWQGREGLVHECVLHDFHDLYHWQVYASGAPVMVEAAHTTLTARGLPAEEFFSDAFFLAKDLTLPL